MAYNLRQATPRDIGQMAYLILVWDSELPGFLQMVRGDANAAQKAAEIICGPGCATWVAEEGDKLIGAIAVNTLTSLFGFHRYGSVIGVMVLPKYRGTKFIGLRLIKKAMELKEAMGWTWLELTPWADDVNTQRVLERLGFDEALHTYILR